ncbi:MAG: pro-sigmaK processing inhibitor BofA family protein [Clostridia bacterium]|nr:pro-sigmaK processing inhibitor BofA family protein [Clostridia bacterium]
MPEYSLIICMVMGLAAIISLAVMLSSGHFFKSFFVSALSGIGSLFAVNLLSFLTGVSISVNTFSLLVCTLLGSCGSISLLFLNIIENI